MIATLQHDNIDLSEEAIPSEMIKLCINTLTSEHVTPEEQSLCYFTRNKLKNFLLAKK